MAKKKVTPGHGASHPVPSGKLKASPQLVNSVRVTGRGVPNPPPRTGPRPQDRSKRVSPSTA